MRNRVLVEKTPDQFIAASLIAIHTWHRPLKLITTLAVVFPFNFLHSLLSSSSLLSWCTDKTDFCESRYRKYHISSHFLFLFSFVHFDFSLFHPIHIGISLYIIIISIAKTVCCVLNNPLHRKKDSFFSLSFNKKKILDSILQQIRPTPPNSTEEKKDFQIYRSIYRPPFLV